MLSSKIWFCRKKLSSLELMVNFFTFLTPKHLFFLWNYEIRSSSYRQILDSTFLVINSVCVFIFNDQLTLFSSYILYQALLWHTAWKQQCCFWLTVLFSGFLSAELGLWPYLEHTSISPSGLPETLNILAGREIISQNSCPGYLRKRGTEEEREGKRTGRNWNPLAMRHAQTKQLPSSQELAGSCRSISCARKKILHDFILLIQDDIGKGTNLKPKKMHLLAVR